MNGSRYDGELMHRTGTTVVAAQRAAVSSAVTLSKVDTNDGDSILQVARQMKLSFIDLSFPPDPASEVGGADPAQWLRIRDAAARMTQPNMPHDLHTPPDTHALVVPGLCSNRRWLSLLVLVCPADVTVPSGGTCFGPGAGYSVVNLPERVVVDDLVPWRKGVPLHAMCTPNPAESLWVPMAEKALAKTLGSYARLASAAPSLPAATLAMSGKQRLLREAELSPDGTSDSLATLAASQALVVLRPSGVPSRLLHQPKALYTVGAAAGGRVFVYCPVVESHMPSLSPSHALRAIDAQWIALDQLHTVFQSWCVVSDTQTGGYVQRKRCPVDLSQMLGREAASPSPLPPPPPSAMTTPSMSPAVCDMKFARLQRENDALTQIHLDALRTDDVGADRLRLLRERLQRLQEENAAMTPYRLDNGVLEAVGRQWVPLGEGHNPDYTSLVERQQRRIDLLERRLQEQEVDHERMLACIKAEGSRREDESSHRLARATAAHKAEIEALHREFEAKQHEGSATSNTLLLSELEMTVKALSGENAKNRTAHQRAKHLEAELAAAQTKTTLLEEKVYSIEDEQAKRTSDADAALSMRDYAITKLSRELEALREDQASEASRPQFNPTEVAELRAQAGQNRTLLQALEEHAEEGRKAAAAITERDTAIQKLQCEVEDARVSAAEAMALRAQAEARCAEQEGRMKEASVAAAQSDMQRGLEAHARALHRDVAVPHLEAELASARDVIGHQQKLLVSLQGGIDKDTLANLVEEYQKKFETYHEEAMRIERDHEEEKQGLIALNVKEMARHQAAVDELVAERESLEAKLADLSSSFAAATASLEELAEERLGLLESVGRLEAGLEELNERREAEGQQMQEAHDELAARSGTAIQDVADAQGRCASLAAALQAEEAKVREAEDTTRQVRDSLVAERSARAAREEELAHAVCEKQDAVRRHTAALAHFEEERAALGKEVRSLTRSVAERDETIESLHADKARLKQELDDALAAVVSLRQEVRAAQAEIWQLTKARDDLENKLQRCEEAVADLTEQLRAAVNEKNQLSQELVDASSSLNTVSHELRSVQAANAELRQEAEELRNAIFRGDDALNVAETAIRDLNDQKAVLQEKVARLGADLENAVLQHTAAVAALEADVKRVEGELRTAQETQERMAYDITQLETQRDSLEAQTEELSAQLGKAQQANADLTEAKAVLVARCDAHVSEANLLKQDAKEARDRQKALEDAIIGKISATDNRGTGAMVDHRRLRYYSSVFGAKEVKRRMAEKSEDSLSVCSVSTVASSNGEYTRDIHGASHSTHSSASFANNPPSPSSSESCASSLAHNFQPCSAHESFPTAKEQQLVDRILVGAELVNVVQSRLLYQKVSADHRRQIHREMLASLMFPSSRPHGDAEKRLPSCRAICRELLQSSQVLAVRNGALISQISQLTARRLLDRVQGNPDCDLVELAVQRLLDTVGSDDQQVSASAKSPISADVRRAADVHFRTLRTVISSTCHEQRRGMALSAVDSSQA